MDKEDEKVAFRCYVFNDMGGGGSYCDNCDHNYGYNSYENYEKCPGCGLKVVEQGLPGSYKEVDEEMYSKQIYQKKKESSTSTTKTEAKKFDISTLVETIEAKRDTEVKMHPYGFLQLSLSEGAWRDSGYRLHVWSDDLPSMKRPEFQVHDHIYGVKSKILLGRLRDTQYIVEEDAQGEYLLFRAAEGKLLNTKQKVSCTKRLVSYFEAGKQYFVVKGDFHSSESVAPLTATLFQKVDADLSISPLVVGPGYYEKTELLSDDRTFDQQLAWRVIGKAIEEIKKRYRFF